MPVVAAALLTSCTVGPLKVYTARAAPHYGPVDLFLTPGQQSYPSGHLANAIVWYGVLCALLARYLSARVHRLLWYTPAVLVSVATTYLGYHWVTDTVAGLTLGGLVYRAVLRLPWWRVPLPRVLDRAEGVVPVGRDAGDPGRDPTVPARVGATGPT